MKKLYIFVVVCVLLMFSGCGGDKLPEITDDNAHILKTEGMTRGCGFVNAYPDINIGNIKSLPVYRVKNADMNLLYQNVIDLETSYIGSIYEDRSTDPKDVASFDWFISDTDMGMYMRNFFYLYSNSDYAEESYSSSASNFRYRVYFCDILQDKYSEIFPFPFDEYPPLEIPRTVSCDKASELLRPVAEDHIRSMSGIYPQDYIYTGYDYFKECYHRLVLNFRPGELRDDKEILLDYFDLCNKLCFEFEWNALHKNEKPDEYINNMQLTITDFTTENYEYLGDCELITKEEAAEKFEKEENVFYYSFHSREVWENIAYDDIYLVYIANDKGYIRPVYTAVRKNERGTTYIKWTDAIKNKYISQKEDN